MLVGSTRTLSSQRRSILGTPTPAASATALRATAGTSLLDFVSWAIKREIQFSSVRPEGEDGSRRVVATGRVSPGAVLVSVPEATALTVRPSERCPFHDGVLSQQAWSSLPWFAQLALKLLLQTAQGAASSYATYLAVLPTASVPLLALWSDQQLHQLHYPALAAKARQDREIWTQAVETARPALTALRCSDDDLLWALALVRSRSFAAPCFPTPASVKLAAAGALQVAAACLAVGSGDAAAALPPLELLALGAPLAWLLWELRVASTVTQYSVCPFIDFFNHSSDSKV